MIKRLIFDVDGTLINMQDFTSCVEKTLKKLNIYSEENVKHFLEGMFSYEKCYNNYNFDDYTKHIGSYLNVKLPDNFVQTHFTSLKPFVPPQNQSLINILESLSKKYEMVLLTNYFSSLQQARLCNFGIGKFFSFCYGEDLIKPAKEAFINACGKNNPSECVMIGDNIDIDIIGAKEAGLKTIFVNSNGLNVNQNLGMTVNSVEEISLDMISKLESDSNGENDETKKIY